MAIIAFVIPVVQGIITHKLEDLNYINMIKNIPLYVLKYTIIFMTISIPLWIILVFFTIFIIYNFLKHNTLCYKKRKNSNILMFEGVVYTWNCNAESEKELINSINPICICGCNVFNVKSAYMGRYKYNGYLLCSKCNNCYNNNIMDNKEAVKRLIVSKYKEKNRNQVNFKRLTRVEKNILKLFYNKQMRTYTNDRIILDFRKYNSSIEDLVNRGIIKKINTVDVVCSFSGGLFKLTNNALKQLNKIK